MEVLHRNSPVVIIQQEDLDRPSLRLEDSFDTSKLLEQSVSNVFGVLITAAIVDRVTLKDLKAVADNLAEYIRAEEHAAEVARAEEHVAQAGGAANG